MFKKVRSGRPPYLTIYRYLEYLNPVDKCFVILWLLGKGFALGQVKYKQIKCDKGKDEPLVCYSMAKLVFVHNVNFTVVFVWGTASGTGWNRRWEERSMLGVCYWQYPHVWLWMYSKLCTYMHSYVLLRVSLSFSVQVFSVFLCSVFHITWTYFLSFKNEMSWVVINMKRNFGSNKSFTVSSWQVKLFHFLLAKYFFL